MTVQELKDKFEEVLEIGIKKSVGVEDKDHWLIQKISDKLNAGITDGVLNDILMLEKELKKLK